MLAYTRDVDVPVLVVERRHSRHEFEDEDAEGPPVGCAVVALLQNDFRGEVLGGAAQSVCLAAGRQLLCKAKVRDLEVAVGVDEKVLRFQITAEKRHFFSSSHETNDISTFHG